MIILLEDGFQYSSKLHLCEDPGVIIIKKGSRLRLTFFYNFIASYLMGIGVELVFDI